MKTYKKKMVIIGDAAVGKTSLVNRFVLNRFDDKYISTIGTKISKKHVSLPDVAVEVELMIWDVLGQHGFEKVKATSFAGSEGAFLVCDQTRAETFTNLIEYWLPNLFDITGKIPVVFIVNKNDLSEVQVKERNVRQAAENQRASYIYTSAKSGKGVEDAFEKIARNMVAKPVLKKWIPATRQTSIESLSDVVDAVMDDFVNLYGEKQIAMDIVRKQFTEAGVDIKNPQPDSIRKAINNLCTVETKIKGPDHASKIKQKRLKWLNQIG